MTQTDLAGAWIERPIRSTKVQDALAAWELDATHRLRWNPYTVRQCRKHITQLAASAGKDDLADITVDDALAWLMIQPSPQTARTRRSVAGAVYRFLIMRGVVKQNPLAAVTMPRVPAGKGADILTFKEVQKVLEVARRDCRDGRSSGPARARFYLFLWGTALRIGEARVQRWDDIDWRTGVMRLTKSKMRREDNVVLPAWLIEELKKWPRRGTCDLVLEAIPSHQAVQRDFERAGITGKGIYHRFRKGAISHMAKSGVPLHVLAKFSRHRNVNVLMNSYVTVDAAELRMAQRLMAI